MTLSLRGVSRRFGAFVAIDSVSFEVKPGEVVGLLGPNGAGKTTTFRVLTGLLAPHAGEVFVDGIDVRKDPLAARRKLGFLTASLSLYERLTGREILEIFGALCGLEGAALNARIEATIESLRLHDFIDQRCGTLSTGQKQRVSIGRATVHDPPVLVLDEPTAALDPVASRDIMDLVRRARAEGKAVLFSTHRMDEAELVCQRMLVMNKGTIVARGTVDELKASTGRTLLTEAFLTLVGADA